MKTEKIIIAALFLIIIAVPALSQPVTLVAVGDSLTAGDGDDGSGGGYSARLLTMLQKDYPGSALSNRAISGDTTQDLINKQLADAVSDLNAAPAGNLKIAVIWIGSNDLFGLYAGDVCTEYYPDLPTCEQTEMAISYDNVNKILNDIKATGAAVYIALLDDQTKRPVIADPSLRNETFPDITDDEVLRMSTQITKYNNQVKAHAASHGAETVDFFNTTIFENTSTLSDDGNHPNGVGYDAIAQIWYQEITKEITGEISPPSVVTEKAASVTATGAALNGSVNPNGAETNYYFEYGLTGSYGTKTSSESTGSGTSPKDVSEQISGLNSGTVYHYRLTANNSEGTSHGNDQTFTTRNDTIVTGNIDGSPDGLVNLADAILALQVCAGISTPNAVLAAEVNQDNRIGLAEAIYALQTAAGMGESDGELVQPSDFRYLGAFRLPVQGEDEPPKTFAYGGNAMAFNPDGDSGNGSLFIMGHDRQPWGDLPDGGQVAEVRPPTPVGSKNLNNLNTAEFLQNFTNIAEGYFSELEELPRIGMTYLNNAATGPRIHLIWGQHHKPDMPQPTCSWFNPNLSTPDLQGLWYIGELDWYSINGYMFEIPASWADAHTGGKYLGTGRAMDGGWGGMGPSLIAYRPWKDDGSPVASGTHLPETTLLLYEDTQANGDIIQNSVEGHQHPDEWEGGAWVTTASGKSAVLFVANKGTGTKYWYGYRNPDGPEYPCVNTQAASEFTACRMADGSPCPDQDMVVCDGHTSAKGWWCARFTPRFVLYDPADLAKVASGAIKSWDPQPYDHLDIGEHLLDNPSDVDLEMLGEGIQRRYRFGDVAYDRDNNRIYVLELFADDAKPVVHVWDIR